jgi:DNA-binding response OmpR family regulator
MKVILLVEDDEAIRTALAELLEDMEEGYRIIQAVNGREAINVLYSSPVDLVITDLNMPVLDGFALLAHLMGAHARMPVIVLTAYGTAETRSHLRELGASYLEKPRDLPALPHIVREKLAQRAKGHIEGITLAGLLQILNLERKSCTLRVISRGRIGELCCGAGEIIHAECTGSHGVDAVHEILGWDETMIEIAEAPSLAERTIEVPLLHLLLDSARRRDEEAHKQSTGG